MLEKPNVKTAVANPKVLIETWGCQMNVADSETMLALLQEQNYESTEEESNADLILLNTCHIRDKAKHKVLSRLGRLKELKDKNPNLRIAVAGCVAQAEGKRLLKEAPQIDYLFGPGKINELPELLKQQKGSVALGFHKGQYPESKVESKARPSLSGKNDISRFINITQGCDNFCTFCVVPHTRGREISRHPREILAEAQALIEAGAKEITLLGQNVNSYGNDLIRDSLIESDASGPFYHLLKEVCQIGGLKRLRFTTSNPHDFSLALAQLFKEEPKLGQYLHLPVQSGDDTVLEAMKRKVTAQEYLDKVAWLRKDNPDFALSTDLIVGFPGETEEQFENTLKLVAAVRFSFIYAFMYSPRKNTPAARFRDQISDEIMKTRLARLNALQDQITIDLNRGEIGKEKEVLIMYASSKNPDHYYGRTPEFRSVRVASSRPIIGETVHVRIVDANKTALIGDLL
jgi:tRNA-2-methylthio-N6-dimethylallyladenosine synthase